MTGSAVTSGKIIMTAKAKIILKVLFSLVLLLFVLSRVNLTEISDSIKGLFMPGILLVLTLSMISILFAARRSQLAVGEKTNLQISLWESYRYYLAGMFYNNIFPTAIGGDLVRIFMINKKAGQFYLVSSTVFMERLCGLFATLILSLSAALVLYVTRQYTVYMLYLIVVAILFALAILLLFSTRFHILIRKLLVLLHLERFFAFIEEFIRVVQEYRNNRFLLMEMMVWSILFQLSDIIAAYLFSLLIGFKVSFLFFLLFIPLVYIITLLPISINGLGLRENALVFLFSGVGAAGHQALLLSILIYLDRLIKGITGGLIIAVSTIYKNKL